MLRKNKALVNLNKLMILMMEAYCARLASFYNFAAGSLVVNPENVGLNPERVGRGGHEAP